MKFDEKYEKLIEEGYVAYIATAPWNLPHINKSPLGLEAVIIDATDISNEPFLDLINQGDGASYGPKELPMPKWVQVDCGFLPSAFVGLAVPVELVPKEVKTKLKIPEGYKGLVPVAAACAIPTMEEGIYAGHTLWSLIPQKGLGTFANALNFVACGCKEIKGVAQYDNPSLKLHTKFGPLKVESVFTPGHSLPYDSFTFSLNVDEKSIEKALSGNACDIHSVLKCAGLLDPKDMETKIKMHEHQTKDKYAYYILPPGHKEVNGKVYVAILEIKPIAEEKAIYGRC